MKRSMKHRSRKHRRQTRKKQRGGGKLEKLPLKATTKPEIMKELASEWEFLFVMGHGALLPDKTFKVPANTYIIFNAPAGCRAVSHGALPHADTIVHDTPDAFLSKFADDHLGQTGLLETLTTAERTTVLAECYPESFFKEEGSLARSTVSKCLSPPQKKRTIYGPDEVLFDMSISFKNNMYESLVLGVYNMPLHSEFEEHVYGGFAALEDDRSRMMMHFASQDKRGQEALLKSAKDLTEKMDIGLFQSKSNMRPDLILQKANLSQVITDMGGVTSGKNRFIFVGSCRGIEEIPPESNILPIFSSMARTASVTGNDSVTGKTKELASGIKLIGKMAQQEYDEAHRLGTKNTSAGKVMTDDEEIKEAVNIMKNKKTMNRGILAKQRNIRQRLGKDSNFKAKYNAEVGRQEASGAM
jgi:hypothetical protein